MTGINGIQNRGNAYIDMQSIGDIRSPSDVSERNAGVQDRVELISSTASDIIVRSVCLFKSNVRHVTSDDVRLYDESTAESIASSGKVLLNSSTVNGNISSTNIVKVEESTIKGLCVTPKIQADRSTLQNCQSSEEIKLTDCKANQVTSLGSAEIVCPNEMQTYNVVTANKCEVRNCHVKLLVASQVQAFFSVIDNLHVLVSGHECTVNLSHTTARAITIYPPAGINALAMSIPYIHVSLVGGIIPDKICFWRCFGECDHIPD